MAAGSGEADWAAAEAAVGSEEAVGLAEMGSVAGSAVEAADRLETRRSKPD
jgi:hypothetical protein